MKKPIRLNNQLISFVSLLIAIFFFLGLAHLFVRRFEAGDSFPSYSSYRADPLGCKIFYDSLTMMKELSVERNIKPLHEQALSDSTTLFVLGIGRRALSSFDLQLNAALNQFVLKGGRLIVTLYPETLNRENMEKRKERQHSRKKEQADLDEIEEEYTEEEGAVEFTDSGFSFPLWDVTVDYPDSVDVNDIWPQPAAGRLGQLSVIVPWNGRQVFTQIGEDWRPVLSIAEQPVMIEKRQGRGSIIIATDSYFVSNEAMWKDRRTEMLTWLIGKKSHVVFNETHHWVTEKPSIAGLARKYDLEGVAIGVILLVLLFLWKNALPLNEPYPYSPEESRGLVTSDRDHFSGLVTIIRRSVNSRDLIAGCVEEWRKSSAAAHRGNTKTIEKVNKIFMESGSNTKLKIDVVEQYNRITQVIEEKGNYGSIES
jgi:hypothetical protein